MTADSCGICGGDGRIANSFGLVTRCPGCQGTGRRAEAGSLFHDVTKTKPSHHTGANKARVTEKQTWPTTFEGDQLATLVQNSNGCSPENKSRLIREIIEFEGSHGRCTKTFIRKMRKQALG